MLLLLALLPLPLLVLLLGLPARSLGHDAPIYRWLEHAAHSGSLHLFYFSAHRPAIRHRSIMRISCNSDDESEGEDESVFEILCMQW